METVTGGPTAAGDGPMVTVGVDLAGHTGTTGVCRVTWSGEPRVEFLPARSDEDLLAAVRSADRTGLDAPLGWPIAFATLLGAHQSGAALPARDRYPRSEHGSGLGNRFTHRLTDDVAWKRTGAGRQRPLSVSTDKLGAVALRAADLMERLADGGPALPRDGSGPVLEVYPAYALLQWGLAQAGTYKGKDGGPARAVIVPALEDGLGLGLPTPVRERCLRSDHDLDAFVSAVVARAAALGLTDPPRTDEERAAAAVEGWMHLPRRGADLAGLRAPSPPADRP
ncbi:DUF429 domain-containing protein [Streptomyces sp. NK15101]|uniref:DUF429 domain-containing protein n=1 Tax=Streptomyces sp. NK15101 TaxID=2873261 RepID=UPI0027E1CE3F|nr:DUF429 domain-containing protein [Streptomyces sp. NK15101]